MFILLFPCFLAHSQDIFVKGKIRNQTNIIIDNVTIVVYENKTIKGYDYSNNEGMYAIKLSDLKAYDTLKIIANGLGYQSLTKGIVFKGQKEIVQDFVLTEKVEELNEVVLEAWEKIKVNKDTVTFKASTYMNGSEQTVEDLLKNLPGVEVLDNGNIKVNGKSIDKLLVEGDDLFDEKYKLLSKNLDAKIISDVQILNNFEDNPVLKSFQESEKVALNLKLKDGKKNVWFGNASIGLGTNERYEGSANLGLLKKKVKFFNLTSLNNTRKLAGPQVKNSGAVNISGLQTEKKIEKQNNTVVNIDNLSSSNFSANEDVFNDSFLNSLSLVTNLSENTKLRSLSYYTLDKIDKYNSSFIQYFTTPETIEYSEEKDINTRDVLFATELELKHFSRNKTYFKYDFSLENNPTTTKGNLISNDNIIFQVQDDKKHNFYNHLNITKKLTENNLLSLYAYYGLNNTKQDYSIQPNIFSQQFGGEDPQSLVRQNSDSPLQYTGVVTEIIRKQNSSEFGLELLGSHDYDKVNSNFTIDSQPAIDSLSNNTKYKKTTLTATGKYAYALSDNLKLRSSISLSQNYIDLNNSRESLFFVNPKIGLKYNKKVAGILGINYSFTNNLPTTNYLNENYILKNYRTFSKGPDKIDPSKNHNFSLTYAYKNYKKLFLVNSHFLYSFSDMSYGQETTINETLQFNTYKILDGGDTFSYSLGITRYLNNLPISIKLNTQQFWSNSFVTINDSFGKVNNYSSNYSLQGTTYLNIPLNFKFHFQYNYSNGQFNDQKTSNDYLEASLNSILELSEKWVVQMHSNYYSINSNNFLFTNMEVNLNPKEGRWSYRLVGNNLSNIHEFSNVYISEYRKNSSRFKIVPRYVLLNVKYRF